jgi:predicted nucleic acid-binding protein
VRLRLMLDTHLLDELLDDPDLAQLLIRRVGDGAVELLVTHLQLDEVAAIPDSKSQRRLALDQLLATLPATRIPTYGFVVGRSRLNEARITDDVGAALIERLRVEHAGNTADAVIAATAWREGATLVTNDRRALRRASREGIDAVTPGQLLVRLSGDV